MLRIWFTFLRAYKKKFGSRLRMYISKRDRYHFLPLHVHLDPISGVAPNKVDGRLLDRTRIGSRPQKLIFCN